MKYRLLMLLILLAYSLNPAFAKVDFLSDYSKLANPGDGSQGLVYIAPESFDRLGSYDSIFVDQPEIFISSDSKYKGFKPDDMKTIADAMRQTLIDELSKSIKVVDQPGLGVLYLRVGLTDLYLKKAKRGLLSYTPIGAVAHAAKSAMQDDIMKKISLISTTVEGELLDSTSGIVLAAIVEGRGQAKDKKKKIKEEASSWGEIAALLQSYATRLKCRIDNSRIPKDQWAQCRQ